MATVPEILEKISNKELVAIPSEYFAIFIEYCKEIQYDHTQLAIKENDGKHIIGLYDASV